jgi:membrane-bound inhibitor of C-type lysozyme
MEVVVLRIAKSDEGADYVDKGYVVWSALHSANICVQIQQSTSRVPTHSRGILAKVSLLVAA